jgi:hypothetical protein
MRAEAEFNSGWAEATLLSSHLFFGGRRLSIKALVRLPRGPFVGVYDPFGECRFSWLEDSLVYNVLPGFELFDKPFAFIAFSPFCQERR